jgi:hypothetical protein
VNICCENGTPNSTFDSTKAFKVFINGYIYYKSLHVESTGKMSQNSHLELELVRREKGRREKRKKKREKKREGNKKTQRLVTAGA